MLDRSYQLNNHDTGNGRIVYWMSRDMRINDNWAFNYAQTQALKHKVPLVIVFNLIPNFPNSYLRHYDFMIKGLLEIIDQAKKLNIDFEVLTGDPFKNLVNYCRKDVVELVTDFSPLKNSINSKKEIASKIKIRFTEIDTHNIIPARVISAKQEFSAYTFRLKANKILHKYLIKIPKPKYHPFGNHFNINNSIYALEKLKSDASIGIVKDFIPGEKAAFLNLERFIKYTLDTYSENKNDPSKDNLSNLSPYLHFGQISSQQIVLKVINSSKNQKSIDSFLEEIIIRKELADNYCLYNDKYDSFQGFPMWAQDTLNKHRADRRPYIYTESEFEDAKTHDNLWNAAQIEMINKGKMHGYMRMYWAKKILEWTEEPEAAIAIATKLNDKYELDGRDPNGYVGINWSIGGLHDRPWKERDIFGMIRYMNYNGASRKFNINKYISKNLNNDS